MDSVLNVRVSLFRNYNTVTNPEEVTLLSWLKSIEEKENVLKLRRIKNKEERDKVKSSLPAITPSGTFYHRSEKGFIEHSGFIQFDIDKKDNLHIANFGKLKDELCKIPNVAYCGVSVSGTGYWGLVPIANPDKHPYYFMKLQRCFRKLGIVIDPAPKSVASLRGYSYDEDAYFNHQAVALTCWDEPFDIKPINKFKQSGSKDERIVQACIQEIIRKKLDITSSYESWFVLGCSIAHAFGETGRDYYHQLSQFHPKYSTLETNKKYDECLKPNKSPCTIATFLHHCRQANIMAVQTHSNLTIGLSSTVPAWEDRIIINQPCTNGCSEKLLLTAPKLVLPDIPLPFGIAEKIAELEGFFKSISLPNYTIQLDPATYIANPALCVKSHLRVIYSPRNQWRFKEPYFFRLQKLRFVLMDLVTCQQG
jgi:hypothetical protein